jgi:Holliday junction resolvasome RuvABC endonuclease subunit
MKGGNMAHRILGVDQAKLTGWAVLNKVDGSLVDSGLIDLGEESKPMLVFSQKLAEIIDNYMVSEVVWERLVGKQNTDTVRQLGRYEGVLELLCEDLGIPHFKYPVVTIRSTLGVPNKKIDTAKWICNKFDLPYPTNRKGEPTNNKGHPFFNQTDAIAIAYCHYLKGEKRH